MKYARKALSALLTLAVTAAIILFLTFPAHYAESVKNGISLWAVSVLPATLPFLFLTAVFTNLGIFRKISGAIARPAGKLFRVSGEGGCAALLSAISGYPVGARTVLDLAQAGRISEEEKFRVACLSTTTGPAFLVGAVGCGMFRSAAIGWILYISHLAGVYAVCFFLRFRAKPQVSAAPRRTAGKTDLAEILMNSVLSVLCVGAAIAVFYAFGQMLADAGAFLSLPSTAESLLRGMLEMTTGCACFSRESTALNLSLCCFLVTFGGLCVLVQQLAFLSRAGVKAAPFIAVKLLQGAASAAICFPLALAVV